jgi:hypothetical protein
VPLSEMRAAVMCKTAEEIIEKLDKEEIILGDISPFSYYL